MSYNNYNNNQYRNNQPLMPGDEGYRLDNSNQNQSYPGMPNHQGYNNNQSNYQQSNTGRPMPSHNNYAQANEGYPGNRPGNNHHKFNEANENYPGSRPNHQNENYSQQQHFQNQNYQNQGQNYQNMNNNNMGSQNYSQHQGAYSAPFNFKTRDHMFVGEVNGQQLNLSDCSGNKKALLIGINYFNTKAELRGCINDVNNIANLLLPRFNFPKNNVTILTDDQKDPMRIPTYDNIVGAMKWLAEGARPGDSLFLHYSGHGGSLQDQDGDEEDGYDETILPLDYEQKGQIRDDLMFDLLIRDLPKGVRLTAIFDSCHSGSVLDLPFTYKHDGTIAVTANSDSGKELALSLLKAGLSFSQGNKEAAISGIIEGFKGFLNPRKSQAQLNAEKKSVVADVIQFAGCRDDQTSADAVIGNKPTGAMSFALCQTLKENPNQSYVELLNNLRSILSGKYTQIPQISTGYAMDLNNPFFM